MIEKEMRQEAPMGHAEDKNTVLPQSSVESARRKFLNKVEGIVNHNRNSEYGTAEDSFETIAEFWVTYLRARHGIVLDLTALDIAAMMDLLKTARIATNPNHMDSWLDKAGYSACAGGILVEGEIAKEQFNDACKQAASAVVAVVNKAPKRRSNS